MAKKASVTPPQAHPTLVEKAGDLLSFFEKNKNTPVPPELDDFLKSHPPATAPVIIEFKLKN